MSGARPGSRSGRRACRASLVAGGLFVAGAGQIVAAADVVGGTGLLAVCTSCHRLDGRYTGIGSIFRWEPEEIVDKMLDARSNERANNAMRAVSLSLSDAEITAVANEVAALGKTGKPR